MEPSIWFERRYKYSKLGKSQRDEGTGPMIWLEEMSNHSNWEGAMFARSVWLMSAMATGLIVALMNWQHFNKKEDKEGADLWTGSELFCVDVEWMSSNAISLTTLPWNCPAGLLKLEMVIIYFNTLSTIKK